MKGPVVVKQFQQDKQRAPSLSISAWSCRCTTVRSRAVLLQRVRRDKAQGSEPSLRPHQPAGQGAFRANFDIYQKSPVIRGWRLNPLIMQSAFALHRHCVRASQQKDLVRDVQAR